MSDNKKLLYEKIVEISEKKSAIIQENEELKKKLDGYQATLFEDFCEFVNLLVEKVDFEKEIVEGMFSGNKSEEEMMAKYFVRIIKEKAKEKGLDAKVIALNIANMLKGI